MKSYTYIRPAVAVEGPWRPVGVTPPGHERGRGADRGGLLRPYAITGARGRSRQRELEIESLVRTNSQGTPSISLHGSMLSAG